MALCSYIDKQCSSLMMFDIINHYHEKQLLGLHKNYKSTTDRTKKYNCNANHGKQGKQFVFYQNLLMIYLPGR